MPRSSDGEEDTQPVDDGCTALDYGVGGAIGTLTSSLSAPEAPCGLADEKSLVAIARVSAGERDEERTDRPFSEVNVGAAKDETSKAVFGSVSVSFGREAFGVNIF